MAEHRVDTHKALLAFEIIRTQGTKQSGEYHYKGFTASADFDGYTVYISDSTTTLTIFFHNKYDVKFSSVDALEGFLGRLYALTVEEGE